MASTVGELMSKNLVQVESSSPVIEAARQMASANIGAVVVAEGEKLLGLVTDRDIAIRAVAQGRDPSQTPVSEICSKELVTVSSEDDLGRAIEVMRERAVRRVVVTNSERKPLGVLSLGDLAIARDSGSVLGQISAAPASR